MLFIYNVCYLIILDLHKNHVLHIVNVDRQYCIHATYPNVREMIMKEDGQIPYSSSECRQIV